MPLITEHVIMAKGKVEAFFHSFLALSLLAVGGHFHSQAIYLREKAHDTHWTVGCVNPSSLSILRRKKDFAPAWKQTATALSSSL